MLTIEVYRVKIRARQTAAVKQMAASQAEISALLNAHWFSDRRLVFSFKSLQSINVRTNCMRESVNAHQAPSSAERSQRVSFPIEPTYVRFVEKYRKCTVRGTDWLWRTVTAANEATSRTRAWTRRARNLIRWRRYTRRKYDWRRSTCRSTTTSQDSSPSWRASTYRSKCVFTYVYTLVLNRFLIGSLAMVRIYESREKIEIECEKCVQSDFAARELSRNVGSQFYPRLAYSNLTRFNLKKRRTRETARNLECMHVRYVEELNSYVKRSFKIRENYDRFVTLPKRLGYDLRFGKNPDVVIESVYRIHARSNNLYVICNTRNEVIWQSVSVYVK